MGLTQHIHRPIVPVEQQHQAIAPPDTIDLLAMKQVHTLIDSAFCLQITAELCQVEDRVINAPGGGTPLGNVMDEIFAEQCLFIPHRYNIQATSRHCLHIHAACTEIVITLDAIVHPIHAHLRFSVKEHISTPGEVGGQRNRPRCGSSTTQEG